MYHIVLGSHKGSSAGRQMDVVCQVAGSMLCNWDEDVA